jgi:selenocysteine lyase/cysteine desulfurase
MKGWSERFASFEGVTYLDAAGQGPLPLSAVRAGREALGLEERPDRLPGSLCFAITGEVRALFARLFSCREESVALASAGAAVGTVTRSLALAEGDEVVLPRGELPANSHPWLRLQERGVRVMEVEPDDPSGAVSAAHLASRIGPRTRVVAFAHVSHLHGGRIDPAPVVEAARRVGAVTVVDGSQAAGALPFDFGASGIDLYAASAHQFLLGPCGAGVGLFSPALLERLPADDVNWWSSKGSENFEQLPRGSFELKPGALRYDAEGPASFNNLMPLAESLRLILEATPSVVQAHCRALGDAILERLPAGFAAASPLAPEQKSHVLCIAAQSPQATADAHARLLAHRVVVSRRGDRLRISPHLHATIRDAERFLSALSADG